MKTTPTPPRPGAMGHLSEARRQAAEASRIRRANRRRLGRMVLTSG